MAVDIQIAPPPPPEFNVPPPPVPAFVEACRQDKMLTNDDLLHLSSYLIVGCIMLMVFFTVAACSLRCCTSSASHDWQSEGLLDNCGDDVEVDASSHQHSDLGRGGGGGGGGRGLFRSWPWWQHGTSRSTNNSSWKHRFWQSIETLRRFRCHPAPPEYTINDDDLVSSKANNASKEWPLSAMDQNLDVEQQQQMAEIRPQRTVLGRH